MPSSASVWRAVALVSIIYVLWIHIYKTPQIDSQLIRGKTLPASSTLPRPWKRDGLRIPRKIWQTWHTSLLHVNGTAAEHIGSWQALNPSFRYELLTDAAVESFVQDEFLYKEDRDPELVKIGEIFLNLGDAILRADFFRYLVLYAKGGIYADVDVSCLKPVTSWTNDELLSQADVIVGIESDRHPVKNDWRLYTDYRRYIWGLNNWTIAARAKHPLFRHVIESIAKNLMHLARKKSLTLQQLRDGMDGSVSYKDVIDATGPQAFTKAFLEWKAKMKLGKSESYEELKMLEHPLMLQRGGDHDDNKSGGILILPIRAMSLLEADRADGDGARAIEFGDPVIRHWSEGTWKGTHPITMGEPPDWWPG